MTSERHTPSAPRRPERLRATPQSQSGSGRLTPSQRGKLNKSINEAFAQSRGKRPATQIHSFIERAEGFAPLFNYLTGPSVRRARERLNRIIAAEKAASSLLSALSALCESDGLNLLIRSGHELGKWATLEPQGNVQPKNTYAGQMQRLAEETAELGRYDQMLMPGCQEHMLRRLWAYSRSLQLQAHHARQDMKLSRGDRARERDSLELANYLYQSWHLVFTKRPSVRRSGEFHRVVTAVGDVFGLTIGEKTLKAIRRTD